MHATRTAIIALALSLSFAFAQAPAGTAAPAKPAESSSSKPSQAPATPAAPQTAAPPPSQPAGTKRPPQAKSQEEITAYNAIRNIRDSQQAEQAAKDFETKFPQSELRALVYQNLMDAYQGVNNADKAIEMGRKAVSIDPDNPVVLVMLANVVAEHTRETDLDRDQRYAEAVKYARHALETIPTDVTVAPNTTPDKVTQFKQLLSALAHSAIGFVELNRHNDPAAEAELRQAAELNTVQPDPMVFLRLAIALDHQSKYADALQATNRVLALSPNGPMADLAHREKDRLEKLVGAGTPTPPVTPTPGVATPPPATPPASAPPPPPTTPQDKPKL
jgi:tetratricopeptide (TPR) repeat protein